MNNSIPRKIINGCKEIFKKENSWLAIACILTFSILTAGKEVISGSLVQNVDSFLLVFVMFAFAALFFNVLLLIQTAPGKKTCAPVKGGFSDIVIINISSAAGWILFFYAFKYVEPAIVSAIITATGPLITIFIDYLFRKKIHIRIYHIVTGGGILLASAYLFWIVNSGHTAFNVANTAAGIIALTGALLSGIASVFTTVYSRKLYDKGWSPGQLMANRFYLLILISSISLFTVEGWKNQLINHWGVILLIAIFGLIIPIYILQIGIKHSKPVIVSSLITLGPVFTLFFELFDNRLQWSFLSFIGIIILLLFVIVNIYLNKKEEKNEQ